MKVLITLLLSLGFARGAFPNTTAAVWPMSVDYSNSDVNRTFQGVLSKVVFGDGPTGFKYTSMQFDGMMGSYASFVNEAIPLDVGLGSFTVATHVWMKSTREGLILTWNGLKLFPNGVKMYIVQGTLHVDLYSRDRGLEYGQLMKTFTFLRIPALQWNFLAFSFDGKTNTITLIINELKRDIQLPLSFNFGDSGIETRGGLYLGGHPKVTSPRPLQGRMACSMLFRSVVDLEKLRLARTECMSKLGGVYSTGHPLGVWPLTRDYSSSDLSGNNLHGSMRSYLYTDGPLHWKEGATQLGGPANDTVEIDNVYDTLSFKTEVTMFAHVYFDQLKDCLVNSWHKEKNTTISDGPSLTLTGGVINVKLDTGHYVTDLCHGYYHNQTKSDIKPLNGPLNKDGLNKTNNCNDRLQVKAKKWYFIGFSYNASEETFSIWMDNTTVRYKIGKIGDVHLSSGSVLKLGGAGFKGQMAWVYALSKTMSASDARKMHDEYYRKLVYEKQPFQPVTFWPLDQAKGIVDLSRYGLPGKVTGGKPTKGPSFTDNTAVMFDGNKNSYMRIENRNNTLDFKTTVCVFAYIRMTKDKDTTLVQWRGTSNTTIGLHMSIINGYFTVDLFPRGGQIKGNIYQGFQLIKDVWTFVGFSYDNKDGLLLIWKDDANPVIKNVGQFLLETRGNVYVGGRPDLSATNLEGDVACVSMYGSMMTKDDVLFIKRNCQQRMYLMNSPVGLYPLTKDYLAADVAGYGNNGNPHDIQYASSPDNTPDRAMLFSKKQTSKVEVTNFNSKLDLNKELTLIAFIYVDQETSTNATLFEWDGMAYSSKGLTLQLENAHLTADVYPKKYALQAMSIDANQWYMIGMTYNYYHSSLALWAQKFGANQKAFLAESSVSPQLLATRGNLVIGSSPSLLGATFSGRIACLMIYDKALSMNAGMKEGRNCFNTYLTSAPTVTPVFATSTLGGAAGNIDQSLPSVDEKYRPFPQPPTSSSYRNKVIVPILIGVSVCILVILLAVFLAKRHRGEPRYRHTRLLSENNEENGYAEYHDYTDDWEDDRENSSMMGMGQVKRYAVVNTV